MNSYVCLNISVIRVHNISKTNNKGDNNIQNLTV